MSDNKLLAENTIRRFMKLANTEALSDNFLTENTTEEITEEVEETNEEVVNEEETTELEENTEELEENTEELEENTEELEEQEEEMELDMDMGDPEPEAAPEMAEADMSLTEEEARLLVSLGERLKAAMDAEAGDEPEPEDEAPEAPEEEEMPEMEDDEPAKAYGMEESQEDLVNEVLKRVTKRLVAEKLKNRK